MPTLSIEDGRLWYDEHGHGPPLVCIHGGWLNTHSWDEQVERFADEYRVVRFDLRGHGRTGPTGTRDYSIDLFVDDLERLLDHLDIHRPILCGLSVGGMIAQSYLDRHPDRARGAVVGGPLQSMPPVDIPPMMKPFLSPLPAITGMASTFGSTATFQSLLASVRAITGRRWLTLDPAVRSKALDALDDVSPDEYRKIFRALYEFEPPNLSHIATPVLVLYGAQEAPMVKRQGEQLATTVPQGQLREIPDSGHLINQDNPLAFNEACAAFFGTLAPSVAHPP
ncbi:alpha/beta hydrolase [Halomicroarcula sp. F28]|uniref:alpha/beta fold hydrolase n=1 Tax=Haloarcula salinisoli TaxID=2487746 RepID=UPI001C72E7FC|nr:alpha/beta fold hydrolase [Halomicroarcula salinisoli]MBX0288138.1 alpha/beta hydrolase [Halomicroarcula salinisoli]